jgi:hypothetical protein
MTQISEDLYHLCACKGFERKLIIDGHVVGSFGLLPYSENLFPKDSVGELLS